MPTHATQDLPRCAIFLEYTAVYTQWLLIASTGLLENIILDSRLSRSVTARYECWLMFKISGLFPGGDIIPRKRRKTNCFHMYMRVRGLGNRKISLPHSAESPPWKYRIFSRDFSRIFVSSRTRRQMMQDDVQLDTDANCVQTGWKSVSNITVPIMHFWSVHSLSPSILVLRIYVLHRVIVLSRVFGLEFVKFLWLDTDMRFRDCESVGCPYSADSTITVNVVHLSCYNFISGAKERIRLKPNLIEGITVKVPD